MVTDIDQKGKVKVMNSQMQYHLWGIYYRP